MDIIQTVYTGEPIQGRTESSNSIQSAHVMCLGPGQQDLGCDLKEAM